MYLYFVGGIEMKILETERLVIREFLLDDTQLIFEYSQEDCTKNELPDEVFEDLEETRKTLKFFIDQYTNKNFPLVYAIELKKNCKLIGHASFSTINENGIKVEIGYAIATAYQGNGYASEAIKAFINWGKGELNLENVYGIAKTSNCASWRVLEKSGFKLINENECDSFGGRYLIKTYTL